MGIRKQELAAQTAWLRFRSGWQKENEDVSGASAPDPFAGDWTELGRPDVDFFDRQGSRLSDRVRLYRVNDINFEHDWYMVVRDPLSVPNNKTRCRPAIPTFCGYLNYIRGLPDFAGPRLNIEYRVHALRLVA